MRLSKEERAVLVLAAAVTNPKQARTIRQNLRRYDAMLIMAAACRARRSKK